MKRLLCRVFGHKVPKGRRFLLTERRARCVRCGKRVRLATDAVPSAVSAGRLRVHLDALR